MESHSEISDLRARADELEKKIIALSLKASGGQDALMSKWGLNAGQARILGALADGCVYHISDLAKIQARKGEGNVRTTRTEIHLMRKRLHSDVKLRSIYGRGYRLDEPYLSVVLGVMGAP